MWVHSVEMIAKQMYEGEKTYKIEKAIEVAYREGPSDRHGDVTAYLYKHAHYIAVAVMQMQGYAVTDEMDYDDISEIDEEMYVRWCDLFVKMAEDADLCGITVKYE